MSIEVYIDEKVPYQNGRRISILQYFLVSPCCLLPEIFLCYLLSLSFALAAKMQRYNSFKHPELTFQVAASQITTELPLDSKYRRQKFVYSPSRLIAALTTIELKMK